MSLTNEEAQRLLDMEKVILENGTFKSEVFVKFQKWIQLRQIMDSVEGNHKFLFNVQQSRHDRLKIDLHFHENKQPNPVGLLRIDYGTNIAHRNPAGLNDHVPKFARPYVDKRIEGSHAHFYVADYPYLAWAVPLDIFDFPIKEVLNYDSFVNSVNNFCKKINVRTKILLERRFFL